MAPPTPQVLLPQLLPRLSVRQRLGVYAIPVHSRYQLCNFNTRRTPDQANSILPVRPAGERYHHDLAESQCFIVYVAHDRIANGGRLSFAITRLRISKRSRALTSKATNAEPGLSRCGMRGPSGGQPLGRILTSVVAVAAASLVGVESADHDRLAAVRRRLTVDEPLRRRGRPTASAKAIGPSE